MRINEITSEETGNFYRDQVIYSMAGRIKRGFPNDKTTISKITGLRRDLFWTRILEPRIAKRDYPEVRSLSYWKMIDELILLAQNTTLPVQTSNVDEGPIVDKIKKTVKNTAKATALAAGIMTYGGLPKVKPQVTPPVVNTEPNITVVKKKNNDYRKNNNPSYSIFYKGN